MASLKDTIAKKDEEIERLQLLKDLKNAYPNVNSEKSGANSLRYGSLSSSKDSVSGTGTAQRSSKPPAGKGLGLTEKAASDNSSQQSDRLSQQSDKLSEVDSSQTMDDLKHQNELLMQSKITGGVLSQNINTDGDILGLGDANSDPVSDISDNGLFSGEPDGSTEFTLPQEGSKPLDNSET